MYLSKAFCAFHLIKNQIQMCLLHYNIKDRGGGGMLEYVKLLMGRGSIVVGKG